MTSATYLALRWTPRRTAIRAAAVLALAALIAALLVVAAPGEAFAQDATAAGAAGVGSSAGIAGDWDWVGLAFKLVLVLVAIWAVIVAMRWYVRRTGGALGGIGRGGRGGHMEVLETRALGGQRSLQLVRVGERAVLLGITPERINTLLEVADPDEFARLIAPQEEGAPGRAFASFLTGIGGSVRPSRSLRVTRAVLAVLAASRALTRAGAQRVLRARAAKATPRVAGSEAVASAPVNAARARAAAAAYAGMRVVDLQRALEAAPDGAAGGLPQAAPSGTS